MSSKITYMDSQKRKEKKRNKKTIYMKEERVAK